MTGAISTWARISEEVRATSAPPSATCVSWPPGDPQVDFRYVDGLTDLFSGHCSFNWRCIAESGSDEEKAYDTFIELTDLLRANQFSYKRWDSDVRGMIVSDDLTQKARGDEFKLYTQMSTAARAARASQRAPDSTNTTAQK